MKACEGAGMTRSSEPLPISTFSTAALAPADRFGAWQSSMRVLFDVALADGADPRRFEAELKTLRIDQVLLARCRSQTQTFSRSALKGSLDGLDHYALQVFLKGACHLLDSGRVVRPGDIYVMDFAAPLRSVDETFDNLTLVIPRFLIERNLSRPDEHHLRIVPRDRPLARVIANMMGALHELSGVLTTADAPAAMQSLLSLAEGLLNGEATGQRSEEDDSAYRVASLLAAKRYIEANLHDPDLRPNRVAAAIGLSRTRLYRLFEPLGGVATYVRARRLRRCVRDLLDPRHRHRPIYDIAHSYGFRSEADFSRAFKQAFGRSPRLVRAYGLRAHQAGEVESVSRAYERWLAELAV